MQTQHSLTTSFRAFIMSVLGSVLAAPRAYPLLRRLSVISLMMLRVISIQANACQFHGGRNFGIFPSFHPLQDMLSQEKVSQPISVSHPRSTDTPANTDATLNIQYDIPDGHQNVVITFSGSESVCFLEGVQMPVRGVSGSYPLKYQVSKPGNHKISLHINALEKDEPISFQQNIQVSATTIPA